MKTKLLQDALDRVDNWPSPAQDALAELALEMDAGLQGGDYEPSADELSGIDRGIRGADEGRFATDEQVKAAFAKFRRG